MHIDCSSYTCCFWRLCTMCQHKILHAYKHAGQSYWNFIRVMSTATIVSCMHACMQLLESKLKEMSNLNTAWQW